LPLSPGGNGFRRGFGMSDCEFFHTILCPVYDNAQVPSAFMVPDELT
jgi:hypothetical protein